MSQKSKTTIKNITGLGFLIASLYCLIRSFTLSLCTDIWYDELFTMKFASYSIGELIGLTARDVHPPLYYIIVRLFLLAGNALGIVGSGEEQLGSEMLAKMVSILPFLLMAVYSLTTVRKHFGLLTAGMFSFAIVTMPQMPEYTTEIRMYSWAAFFVTAALLHGFSLYRAFKRKEKKADLPDAIAMYLYATAAAYTHYYAALSAGIVFMFLLVLMLCEYISGRKKESSDKRFPVTIISLLVSMILTAISYLPWVSVVVSQVGAVKNNYWIQPVGIRSLGSAAKHLFRGYFTNDTVAVVCAVLMFAFSAILAVRSFLRAVKKEERAVFEMYAFCILPILVAVGLLASLLLRPVFVNRYMIPSYGAFWLSLSMMTEREIDRSFEKGPLLIPGVVAAAMAVLVAVVGIVDYRAFIGNEQYRKVNMKETLALFEGISSDTIIISNFDQVQGLLGYYLGKVDPKHRVYLYGAEPEALMKEMVQGLETIEDPVDIANYLDAGKTVLFLGSFNSREVILGEWNDAYGITYENEGSYLMERYWFDVFRLRR